MAQLWYNHDEVNDYHPLVEQALNGALRATGFDNIAEVVHHPGIPNSTIIPDFAIRLKANQRYIFICEVKRTERDVESQRYQNQTRSYVTDFGPHWAVGYHRYFCITNLERLIFFADRQGPLATCLLKGNPKQHSKFSPANYDATATVAELQNTFEQLFQLIFNRTAPDWDNNWIHIIENFHTNYLALKNMLGYPDAVAQELTLYEFFRLLAYAYLKDYYVQTGNSNASHFRTYPSDTTTLNQFRTSLTNLYNRVIQLDFRQVFINHPNANQRIFPDNFTANYMQYFKDVIRCFTQYSSQAVADNSSPSYVFNLLTSRIYNRHELHSKGKVMSDSELSNLLATICIDDCSQTVLDPGAGDGALLDAAYDRLSLLASTNNQTLSHNQILSQVDGIEIDPFLSQLAAFRLISKNLTQVDYDTQANILIGDIFANQRQSHYDIILMNPPFLRNDNHVAPITDELKSKMIQAIGATGTNCFVRQARQPNLYFYFVNYIWHYLNTNGKAGLILMAKFLNNQDGEYLKEFIHDKVDAIISYPRKYFQEFTVTTVIIILKKGENSPNVKFIRISDENIVLNPDAVRDVVTLNEETTNASYKLKIVPRANLNPKENWRSYLNDQKYEALLALDFFKNIEYFFRNVSRGGSESSGASSIIYPAFDVISGSYYGMGKRLTAAQTQAGVQRTRVDIPISLNANVSYGIQNNYDRRNLILTVADLEIDKAYHFPARADTNSENLLSSELQADTSLAEFYSNCIVEFGKNKWKQIVNNAFNNTIVPKILIPRADRTKHVVYYNPNNHNLTLSTNFFYCNNLRNHNLNVDEDMQYKFVAAFLFSAFGQIQFEINANNQEGLRKLEGFQIKRFLIPNLADITQQEFDSVVREFDILNDKNIEFSGDEGIVTDRKNLDLAIANIIFSRNTLSFANPSAMTEFFELFLADLVEDRRI